MAGKQMLLKWQALCLLQPSPASMPGQPQTALLRTCTSKEYQCLAPEGIFIPSLKAGAIQLCLLPLEARYELQVRLMGSGTPSVS